MYIHIDICIREMCLPFRIFMNLENRKKPPINSHQVYGSHVPYPTTTTTNMHYAQHTHYTHITP